MIVGLTGGIGSGKSEVSARFERLGIMVVDADIVAREVVAPGSLVLEKIAAHFGPGILTQEKNLDRKKLRAIVFENPAEKLWLENLLHPIIRTEITTQLNQSSGPYTILSSPLLLETNQHELVDRILVVDADEQLQLARACVRDSSSADQIKKIMSSQLSRSTRCAKADDIIHNHGDLDALQNQVELLHERYLQLAQHTSENTPMQSTQPEVIKLNCPTCKKSVLWNDDFPHRPFCSDRCRLIDLGEWASENHKIAGESLDKLTEDKSDEF